LSTFFDQVYQVVRRIPAGTVVTYGQIAAFLGNPRGARTIVWALHSASQDLPFHRVVNQKGTLAPDSIFGGKDHQRSLLEHEGVTFKTNGSIDMEQHLWTITAL
jgi:methylated-DNA-protein-cysteine methyltransferase-like protein